MQNHLVEIATLVMTHAYWYVLPKIIEAKERRLKELDLTAAGITMIPAEVFELTWLEELDLTDNQITNLPEAIAQLQSLTTLYLSYNQITTLPDAIAQLQRLTYLNLRNNQITILPEAITQLQRLTYLNLRNNQITILPEAITQLQSLSELNLTTNQITTLPKGIAQLQSLTNLNLSYNRIATLPEGITQLQSLSELGLTANKITTLPKGIAQLQSLTYLNLSYNQISTLPEGIAQLQSLSHLNLSYNQISTLPEVIAQLQNLNYLNLSGNRIITLPEVIAQMQNLNYLNLNENPIEQPPPEISKRNIQAIKDYFRQLKAEGIDYLYEAKLLILGEGGAGKTSLAKKIQNPKYEVPQEEDTTRGIEVIQWSFTRENGRDFRVNIWDFGGQEIYHATHQFFLTKRSLYTLVADTRKDNTDFYYWLNVVELLSDNSPLLIIKNEQQDRHCEINEHELRGQFANLEKTLATNLATNRGLQDILEEIKHHIVNLPHIGAELPKSWVRVREGLEKESLNHISLDKYLDICQQNGFTQLNDKLQLSGYLHDLGVCLHFQNDPLLNKTVILKPKWGTDAVYKVLDNDKVINNLGKFTKSDLKNIWCDDEYAMMRDELLQLMINFKLCYKIPRSQGTYIAPQLLSVNQSSYNWDETNNLILRYTYEFMPKGIITQFIVVMHRLIDEQKYVWKSGVILSQDQTKAEVIQYYGKREIRIRVAGRHKRDLMTIVRNQLNEIHGSYKRLKYKELIPCNCKTCKGKQNPQLYEFEMLRQRISDQQYQKQCDKSYEIVNVLSLIDDVIDKKDLFKEKEGFENNLSISISPTFNLTQGKENNMATVNQYGYGDNIAGDKVGGDKIDTQINNSQNLTQAAKDIKELLDQLSQEYSNNAMVGAKAIEKIENKPVLKERIIKALKEGGETALEKLVDHPAVSIVVAAAKGFIKD